MTYTIFTYGTLMKGQSNHHYLENSRYIGDAVLDGYGLKEVGYYPAAVPMEHFRVYGELYEIDEETKAEVDILEGVGSLYDCKPVTVHTEIGDMEVLFYEYLLDHKNMRTRIPFGKWNTERMDTVDYVWYATYGSNILKERFEIYINKTDSKAEPIAEDQYEFGHPIYFAKDSKKWDHGGVAFLDMNRSGKAYGWRYLISKKQFDRIRSEEGLGWYNDDQYLKKDEFGIEIRTLTSSTRYDSKTPVNEYLDIIAAGLMERRLLSSVQEVMEYLQMDREPDLSETHIRDILNRKK